MANEQYTQLIKTLEGIRDERGMHANTATRIGSALIELANFVLANGDNFLSKVSDDTAEGFITFLKGLKAASIIVDKITAENLVAEDIKTETLTVDKGEDEPQDGGKTYMQSSGYVRGGKGFGIFKGPNGAWNLDIDNINVRGALGVNELDVNVTEYLGGEVLLTVGGSIEATEVILLEDGGWKVRFKNSDDNGREIRCMMKAGDLAKHQTWNEKDGLHYYWLEVTGVGDDFITLKQLAGDTTKYSEPQVGDEIVHLGNKKDKERQGALIFSARTQSMRIWTGINTTSLSSANDPIDLNPVQSKILAKFIIMSTGETLDVTVKAISEVMGVLVSDTKALKEQADRQFVIWFLDYIPTLTNKPYTDWIADGKDEREMHLQDVCYNKSTDLSAGGGRAWHFEQDEGGNYLWREITDRDTLLALEKAAKAQKTADGKRRVFVVNTGETPVPPYDEGDMWTNATYNSDDVNYDNDTLVVKKGVHKTEGESFNIADWKPASSATSAYLGQLGEQITAYVSSTKKSIEEVNKLVDNAQKDATKALENAEAAAGIASEAKSTADTNTSAIQQTEKSITALVTGGYLDDKGNLAKSVQDIIDVSNDGITALSQKIGYDPNTGLVNNINTSGLLLTENFSKLFTDEVNGRELVNSEALNEVRLTAEGAAEKALEAAGIANEAQGSADSYHSEFSTYKNQVNAIVEQFTLDDNGNITGINRSALVLQSNFASMFTEDIYDGIANSASMSIAIENGISKAKIQADQITLEGHTVINDYFTIDKDGNATVGATDAERTLTVNGTINATKGTFEYCTIGKGCSIFSEEGWNLKGDATGAAWILSGISTKEIELVLNYDGTKTNKLLLRNAPSNGNSMIEIVTYHSNGISVITDNRGIVVEGNSSSAVPLDVTGNVNLRATRSNEHVFVQGLTLNVRTVSVNGTIVNTDDIIVFSNTSDITVMLPPASGNTGKIFYMKKKGSGGVTVISSFGDIMAASGTSVSESNGDVNNGRSMIFISDGTYWISYFCG